MNWYVRLLQKYPYRMAVTSTSSLFMIGDCVSQRYFSDKPYEPMRTARAGIYACAFAPAMTAWFRFLGQQQLPVIAKVAIDQAVFAPSSIGYYFSVMGLLEGKSPDTIWQSLKNQYWDTLKCGWMIWPAFQLFNFGIVPPNFRVLASNCCGLVWNTFLAYQNANKMEKGHVADLVIEEVKEEVKEVKQEVLAEVKVIKGFVKQ
ncbi:protein SYM1 [Yarrowia lipolytica]|uniref:Protein SYM1 n=2 Tax=Yarrowia lipolytica TaxID=4952 RepID=SYM1_YARLI|nr:YALI0C23815p [Yarrowia lipolytica CLIB122]Q6CAW5.1 RecName: Full=Protein SYM1 [Yarrowia lipolytica CLIB122]AOW03325.1 hypothetical protein YALI1_C32823g [Yarrowia lipolytica]KAB8280170.1 protein SYM1 [Yarrowia lipolytica]KAE8170221.1 protein SYM1 [Yarrowia lipolytica]KAJ8053806.1 protein SYM1 [Yarrowia lipolytica]QNP96012.1 Protein SYM1 [Yarrowia lipolytica]|eukprot:XP_502197.1 YALI0C23815p [Yarrowia lipolytica CLIB122]